MGHARGRPAVRPDDGARGDSGRMRGKIERISRDAIDGATGMGWLSRVARSALGRSLNRGAAGLARHGLEGRINVLQRSLERAPQAPAARTDLPPKVLALARMLGVSDDGGGRLVHLTQRGEM